MVASNLSLAVPIQYKDPAQLYKAIALAIYYYNHKRIHTILKMNLATYADTLNSQQLNRDKVFGNKVAYHNEIGLFVLRQ